MNGLFVVENLNYRMLEQVAIYCKSTKGRFWVHYLFQMIGIKNIIASGLDEDFLELVEEMTGDRMKVWRLRKLFEKYKESE